MSAIGTASRLFANVKTDTEPVAILEASDVITSNMIAFIRVRASVAQNHA
jgi:hypothetical protein